MTSDDPTGSPGPNADPAKPTSDEAAASPPAPPDPKGMAGLYLKAKRYLSKPAKLRKVAYLLLSILISFYTLAELFEHQLKMIKESSSEASEAISTIDPLMPYSHFSDYMNKCRYVISGAEDVDGHIDCGTVEEAKANHENFKLKQIAKCEADYPAANAHSLCWKEWSCEDPERREYGMDEFVREEACAHNRFELTGKQILGIFIVTHYAPPTPNSYYLSAKQPFNLIRQSVRGIYKPIYYSMNSTVEDISKIDLLGQLMVWAPVVFGILAVLGIGKFNGWAILAIMLLFVPALAFALHIALLVALSITYGVVSFLLLFSGMAVTAFYGATAFAIKLFHGKKEIAELAHQAAELREEAKKLF
jgi:hypothetical protein